MTNRSHDRARDLITLSFVEGLTPAEENWLQEHLGGCAECAEFAEGAGATRSALRSLSFRTNPALSAVTQALVSQRAQELRERDHRVMPVLVACVVAIAVAAVSTPFVWDGFAALSGRFELSSVAWRAVFAIVWFAPAVLAGVGLLMFRGAIPRSAAE